MRPALPALLFLATFVTLAFLLVPIAAIFLRVPPGDLVDALGSEVARDALLVTLETTVVAQALIIAFGTPTAYLLATRRFPGRSLAVTLIELPLVLPPAVAGIGLLATFGRLGLLGSSLPRSGSRSRSRRSRWCSRSCSSQGRSTSGQAWRRSERSTRP